MSHPLRYRMAIALLTLVAGLVAVYLHLWKLGYVGTLTCSVQGGCQVAMLSRWGSFLGFDVALIGAVGYAALFGISLWSLSPRWERSPAPTIALLALIVPAVLFTIRLKYAEWYVLRTFCPWCFESTVTITLCLVLAVLDWRRVRRSPQSVRAAVPG
jgi:uncharacterized membrane protein